MSRGGGHRLELRWPDGKREHVDASVGQSILEAAEEADVALPFGCRTGACATCTGRLLDGSVEHRRPPRALKPRHLESGYVLTCVAEPTADCRLDVGSDVAASLVSNPWKG